jgi:outer membrane lipoprotein-sorting protein
VRSDPATGELLETTVTDLLGNVTQIAFSGMRTNLRPPDSQFRFDAPKGVRVIELEPAKRPAP